MTSDGGLERNALGSAAFWVSVIAGGAMILLIVLTGIAGSSGGFRPDPTLQLLMALLFFAALVSWFVGIGLGAASCCLPGKSKTMGILGISLSAGFIFLTTQFMAFGIANMSRMSMY